MRPALQGFQGYRPRLNADVMMLAREANIERSSDDPVADFFIAGPRADCLACRCNLRYSRRGRALAARCAGRTQETHWRISFGRYTTDSLRIRRRIICARIGAAGQPAAAAVDDALVRQRRQGSS